jgi:nucleotide-binding universal stress UspA family protein
MDTVVVGYDKDSDAAELALVRAADVAEAFSAQLVVVSVGDPAHGVHLAPPAVGAPIGGAGAVPPGAYHARPAGIAAEVVLLGQARRSLANRRLAIEYIADVGDPAERLLDIANKCNAELIVVGSRERGFLERFFGDAVDEAVARHADRDVLLVH